MQIPYRKPGKYSQIPSDPKITEAKFSELKNKLAHLKKIQPDAAREVARLAELGDFSENAEYQIAKGRLRGINNKILTLQFELDHADIIKTNKQTSRVAIGHHVTVTTGVEQKTFQILGSRETNPAKGIISAHSPIGAALIGHGVGDVVKVKLANSEHTYTIVRII